VASTASARFGGFHENELGWSSDTQRSASSADWALTARAILSEVPTFDNLVYDLSFEANRTLWDRFFLSSGTAADKRRLLDNPVDNPLPNGRLRLADATRASASEERLNDFHQAAYQLMVDGAFNVNSTRVEAWKALLGSTRLAGFGDGEGVPFPRVLAPPGAAWNSGDEPDSTDAWSGYRELSEEEIGRLAEAIVAEVKLRGPFISMSDFVNRRLAEDETGRMGALQAAIERAGLNAGHNATYPLDNRASLPNYRHPDNIADPTRMEQMVKPASQAWGAPSYLTQADVLQVLGPALSARSDSFVVRAYGDAVDAGGAVQARAWCEATVQRTPEPLDPDASGLDPRAAGLPGDFGRRFVITSFRWLRPGEI
jgi:type II secretory pathway pseudopilin PulG